ncbi:hypothetical protein D910_09202 [Dendroctonus ponderosae]|uniref:Uncharacterized protein n=1 Tax=Dendroctonus ponderosae TaxID=77166 RepID=U4UHR6_DENPD|nr:hypothetical protein D910_09202 [Dendroctonus ponderosae]
MAFMIPYVKRNWEIFHVDRVGRPAKQVDADNNHISANSNILASRGTSSKTANQSPKAIAKTSTNHR